MEGSFKVATHCIIVALSYPKILQVQLRPPSTTPYQLWCDFPLDTTPDSWTFFLISVSLFLIDHMTLCSVLVLVSPLSSLRPVFRLGAQLRCSHTRSAAPVILAFQYSLPIPYNSVTNPMLLRSI